MGNSVELQHSLLSRNCDRLQLPSPLCSQGFDDEWHSPKKTIFTVAQTRNYHTGAVIEKKSPVNMNHSGLIKDFSRIDIAKLWPDARVQTPMNHEGSRLNKDQLPRVLYTEVTGTNLQITNQILDDHKNQSKGYQSPLLKHLKRHLTEKGPGKKMDITRGLEYSDHNRISGGNFRQVRPGTAVSSNGKLHLYTSSSPKTREYVLHREISPTGDARKLCIGHKSSGVLVKPGKLNGFMVNNAQKDSDKKQTSEFVVADKPHKIAQLSGSSTQPEILSSKVSRDGRGTKKRIVLSRK